MQIYIVRFAKILNNLNQFVMKKLLLSLSLTLFVSLGFSQSIKRSYYDDLRTRIMEEAMVNTNGELNGPYKRYATNGIVDITCTYKNGRLEGLKSQFNTYTGKQQLSTKEFYKNDLRNGEAVYYNVDGTILKQGLYVNDKKEGVWKFLEPYKNDILTDDGKKGCEHIQYTLTYKGDEVVGKEGKETIKFYPSGKTYKETTYAKNSKGEVVPVGDSFTYFPWGEKEAHTQTDSEGTVIFNKVWWPDGKVKLNDTWENGTRHHGGYDYDGSPDYETKVSK